MEQKDINVNVFSAAPQTCSGEKVFNPNISSAAPQACAAKRAPTYSERLDKLRIFADEAAEELPQVFYRELERRNHTFSDYKSAPAIRSEKTAACVG